MKQRLVSLDRKIEQLVLEHWRRQFESRAWLGGLSSLALARRLGVEHWRVLRRLRRLQELGRVQLNEGVRVGGPTIVVDRRKLSVKVERTRPRKGAVAFPAPEVLQRSFKRRRVDYAFYTNQVHCGASQLEHRYFSPEVLQRYVSQPDKFHFEDSVIGGWIGIRDEYYFALEKAQPQERIGVDVRYGRRRLADGRAAVAAILHDLARLPIAEQARWSAYEVESPVFALSDREWKLYLRQDFGAEWVDPNDPIVAIYEEVEALVALGLYRSVRRNPLLTYPVVNNRAAYVDAHLELRKVIIAPLSAPYLERRLASLDPPLPMPRDTGGQPLTLQGLSALVVGLDPQTQPGLLEPLRRCNEIRAEKAHEVVSGGLEPTDYPALFRSDCSNVAKVLQEIHRLLGSAQ